MHFMPFNNTYSLNDIGVINIFTNVCVFHAPLNAKFTS